MSRARQRGDGRPLVDRSPQTLPIPIGGMAPVWAARRPSPGRRLLRALPTVMLAMGSAAAATGVLLVGLRGPVAVYAAAGSLHVGGSVLTLLRSTSTATLYDGDAAYLLTETGGATVAEAAWTAGGDHRSGSCMMRREGTLLVATCRFVADGRTTTAVDSYEVAGGGSWRRTYDDGQQVSIAVPDGATVVPVAFPVGR